METTLNSTCSRAYTTRSGMSAEVWGLSLVWLNTACQVAFHRAVCLGLAGYV